MHLSAIHFVFYHLHRMFWEIPSRQGRQAATNKQTNKQKFEGMALCSPDPGDSSCIDIIVSTLRPAIWIMSYYVVFYLHTWEKGL